MNRDEVRGILSAYRPANGEPPDPFIAEALREAARDPELSRWWEEEQVFDQAIAAKVQGMPVSVELKSRLLQTAPLAISARHSWSRRITLLAAAIAISAVLFSSWRGPFQPAVSLADYRDEMISFVRIAPSLEMETNELSLLLGHLEKTGAPSDISILPKLRELEATGCRTLRFRGQDVALICFKREDGRLAHLFFMESATLPRLSSAGDRTHAAQGEWMTAAWSERGHTYLLAVQGDQSALEKYFSS